MSEKGLVYGYCDVCDRRGYVKEYKLLTAKIVRLCLKCLKPGYEQLSRKRGSKELDTQAQDNDPHQ